MAELPLATPCTTFVVRFWRERSAASLRWRGRIEHVQSGESASCLEIESILAFIQDLGIMTDHSGERGAARPAKQGEQPARP